MQDTSHSLTARLRDLWRIDKWLIGALLMLMGMRMVAIATTPLEFGVDEAQYWLWGQALDFGYYSKPPLIGWYLGLMEWLFGPSAIAARWLTPAIHTLIALILYDIAARYHSRTAARWAALLWVSLPIVSLGSFVISTDSLLLLPWVISLSLFLSAHKSGAFRLYFYAGAVIGIGLLAKYAAVYFILGASLVIFSASMPYRRRLAAFVLIVAGALLTASPNLLWNLANSGVTIAHLGENADLATPLYSLSSAVSFVLSQSAVIGPVAFVLFIAALLRRPAGHLPHWSAMLAAFCVPVILIMTTQAFLRTANANWAATAWPTGCLLIASFLAEAPKSPDHPLLQRIFLTGFLTKRRFWGRLGLSVNIFAASLIAAGIAFGDLGQWTPKSDPLRRLRGWEALATDTARLATQYNASIIIADRRAEAALLSWHFYDTDLQIKVIDEDGIAGNHFELNHALLPDDQKPYLIMTGAKDVLPAAFAGARGPIGTSETVISANRARIKYFYIVD